MFLSAPRARCGTWLERQLPWPDRRARLRRWRRTRPFWAGLLLLLGGAELLLVPLSPLGVLVSLGLGGLAALGIGLALMVAGLFLWCAPAAHHYVSINALILSVLSFAATNLGGFLVGMGLGIAGGAMGFGWTPARPEGAGGAEGGARARDAGRTVTKVLAVGLPAALLAAVGGPAPQARAAGGIPAPPRPPTVTTTMFAPQGFTLAGVAEVPTADGRVTAMVLRMKAASLTDYRLITRDRTGPQLALNADTLSLKGEVTLYLTRFSGCLEGVLCLTFTPDTLPVPPVVPPFVYMTDVDAEQALVTSDLITADGLRLRAGSRHA
ncbi:hypothetical protein HEK616_42120 [Streptomyces nigrescens]|uniref:Integral membrane protein n=1 Tax=Streptomyces nigrescens TaxID=1920 RepID=A0ABM7ZWK1_STRNI|nr:DUF6114 domain-containing protein [Streptomyces nigrescens]BDM70725.1 hypothetical protein HEK616_42120 [Streptomyces nigrescens]